MAQAAVAEVAVPALKSRVTDLTATLTADQIATLEQTLAAFEARKGSQIAILMLPSTQPEPVEQYAVRVQETWKLGRKGIDDGVLVLVAKNDRKLWIEVGYGLEGALPDAYAKRILEQEIVPRFKQGDFYGGISAGTARIIKLIDGESLPAPRARPSEDNFSRYADWLIPGLVLLLVIEKILRGVFGRFLGSTLVSTVAGGIVWFVAGSLIIALIVAVLAFIVSLFGGGGLGGTRGGWGGGYSGGSWSSGGGGFSGGGGSSGGGGAGGSW